MSKIKKILAIQMILLAVVSVYSNIVYADELTATDKSLTESATSKSVEILSKHAILVNQDSGQILAEHNSREKAYPASTTKLMTAILTLENCNLDDEVVVDKDALLGIPKSYTTASLKPDEKLSVRELMHVLLIPSANDAANVLAYHISGSIDKFAEKMNAKALEIGCENTHFTNPSGIHDDNHYSTAYDMALIGKYATKFDTITEIATNTECSLSPLPTGAPRTFKTTNTLISPKNKYYYEYATGLKTGYTDKARSCIVATAKKDSINLLCVILGGEKTEDGKSQRELDCRSLFEYGFNNYVYKDVCIENSSFDKSNAQNVPNELQNANITYSKTLSLMLPVDDSYTIETNFFSDVQLPISRGTIVGKTTYTVDNVDYSVDLILDEDVLPVSFFDVQYVFKALVSILVIALLFLFIKKKKKSDSKYFKRSLY